MASVAKMCNQRPLFLDHVSQGGALEENLVVVFLREVAAVELRGKEPRPVERVHDPPEQGPLNVTEKKILPEAL